MIRRFLCFVFLAIAFFAVAPVNANQTLDAQQMAGVYARPVAYRTPIRNFLFCPVAHRTPVRNFLFGHFRPVIVAPMCQRGVRPF